MVSGVRSQVAVKIFGEDLTVLQKLGSQIGQILMKMKGSNDLRIEQASGQNYLNIKIDRDAIARYGINVSDVNEVIETAIGGKQASTVYEGERRFPLMLRYPDFYRNKIDAIENIILQYKIGDFIDDHNPKTIANKLNEMLYSQQLSSYKKYLAIAKKEITWKSEKEKLLTIIKNI